MMWPVFSPLQHWNNHFLWLSWLAFRDHLVKKKSDPIISLWWHHTQPCEVCGSVGHAASVYCVQGSLHMVSYLTSLTRIASALTLATPSPPLLLLLSPPPFPFIISTISSNSSEVRLGSNHNSSINYLRP